MHPRRILLYKNGESDPAAMGDLGCYECWFARALPASVRLEVHKGFDAPHRPLGGYDGLLLSGSPRSLVEREPWMDDAAAFVRHAADLGVPVLGVCFGHQLIGYAYGCQVRKNPRGWEAGTTAVRLTEAGRADPLFTGLAPGGTLPVNQSHRDEIGAIGGAGGERPLRVLAENDHSAVQAVALGDHVRSVQFHPEMSAAEVRRLVAFRRAALDADAQEQRRPERRTDALIAGAADTPEAQRVLHNWLDHFVRHR